MLMSRNQYWREITIVQSWFVVSKSPLSFGIGVYIFYGQVSTPENEIQRLQEQQGDQGEGEAQVDLQEGRVIVEWQLRLDWPG